MTNLVMIVNILYGISAIYNTGIYIPQICRLIKIKRSDELSITMFSLFCVTQVIQITYGYIIAKDYEYVIGMIFVFAVCAVTTYLIIYYRLKNNGWHSFFQQPAKYCKWISLSCLIVLAVILLFWLLDTQALRLILSILFSSIFVIVGASFVFQTIGILKHKHVKEFSLTTFIGFNVIQIITAIYACYHNTPALLIGMLVYLVTSGTLTETILYFKCKNREF